MTQNVEPEETPCQTKASQNKAPTRHQNPYTFLKTVPIHVPILKDSGGKETERIEKSAKSRTISTHERVSEGGDSRSRKAVLINDEMKPKICPPIPGGGGGGGGGCITAEVPIRNKQVLYQHTRILSMLQSSTAQSLW
jgi:hypothetical protein